MKQHFVPRIYLKQFSSRMGKGYFVNSFDKQTGKHIPTNINNICAETDLYTLDNGREVNNDVLAVEKIYANFIEPRYLKAFTLLTDDAVFRITDGQRIEIVIGILQLYMRNPRHLKNGVAAHTAEISKQYRQAISNGERELTYLDNQYNLEEWSEQDILHDYYKKAKQYFREQHLAVTEQICNIHKDIKIEVNKIMDHSQFMTSDNPLIADDYVTGYDNALLRSQEFYLTLNRKYAVRLYHDNSKRLNYIYRMNVPDQYVHGYNRKIYQASSRFVIADAEAFNEYHKLEEIFTSTALEVRMELVKEILSTVAKRFQNDEGYLLLKTLYEKYEKHGFVTLEEEVEVLERHYHLLQKERIERQR
ncbi:MAG: DUF4238 domain-containing protein [Flavobacteriales bacterium]|nr:DUF4238 domain-containing protein [Flavobacteriales bacterium]